MASRLFGPYLDSAGRGHALRRWRVAIFRNLEWLGPGHSAMVVDDAGVDWTVYHAISPAQPLLAGGATRRPMLIDGIGWVDGWPVVNGGEGASSEEQPAPTIEQRSGGHAIESVSGVLGDSCRGAPRAGRTQ